MHRSVGSRCAFSALALSSLLTALPFATQAETTNEPADDPVDERLFQALAWRNIGPFRGGRATAVVGVAQHPDRFYMGATGGGVWRTDDAGAHWHNISDGFFATGSVGAIAVAPSDPNVVYVGMGEAPVRGVMTSYGDGVYRSNDAGATWFHIGLGDTRHISRVVVHPHDSETAWVAAQGHLYGAHEARGVYKTTDGGVSWTKTLFVDDTTGASDLSLDPSNPRVLYAGLWHHRRYPWQIESGGPGSGIWKSVDGGTTWERLTEGLPELMGKIGVAVSPARPGRVWAMIEAEEGGLFRSDDAGKTFERVNEDRLLRARSWYYTHVTADPVDAETVYVMNAPLLRSIDGGRTFTQVATPHGDNHALWIHPHDNRLMINANDGGANVSRNRGAIWSTQGNQPTAQFYRVITDHRFPYRIYGGQQDNSAIVIKSRSLQGPAITDQDWHAIGGCESAWPAFDPDHPRYVYAGCYQGLIDEYDMETGLVRGVMAVPFLGLGAEPKDLPYRFNWNAPIAVSPHDPRVIYHAGNVVLRSRDRGRSWQAISPDLTHDEEAKQGPGGAPITNEAAGGETYNTIASLALSPHAAGTVWVGTDDGRVHVTTDDGGSWLDVSPEGMNGAQVNAIEISPHAADTAYLAVHRFKLDDLTPLVYATYDRGASWSLRTDGLPMDTPVRVVREDPARQGLLYVGTETGVFVSFDDGARWQALELGLPTVPVTDLTINNHDLIAATQGRAYWILDDLTPLHAIETESDLAARLLPPRAAFRTDSGQRDIPGAGANPPAGALIHYVIPEPPEEPETQDAAEEGGAPEGGEEKGDEDAPAWTLEILDATGLVIRTVSSRPDEDEEEEDIPVLDTEVGLNRFVWDLRRDRILDIEDVLIFGNRGGYRVGPGTYEIRLSRAETVTSGRLEVLPDPRLEIAPAAFEDQQELLAKIRSTLQATHDSVRRMRAVREQITSLLGRIDNLSADLPIDAFREAGDAASEAIDAWEETLIQPEQETFQDVINFPNRLNAELFRLMDEVDTVEPLVNQGARARFIALEAVWRERADAMERLLEEEVARFTALFDQHAVPAVILPKSALVDAE